MNLFKDRKRLTGILVCIVLLTVAVVFFFQIKPELQRYNSAENVSAVVSRCDHERVYRVNEGIQTRYRIYVDYSLEGEEYTDIYWKTRKSRFSKGRQVTLKIDPEHPETPITKSPYSSVLIVLFCLLLGLKYGIDGIFKPRSTPDVPILRRR